MNCVYRYNREGIGFRILRGGQVLAVLVCLCLIGSCAALSIWSPNEVGRDKPRQVFQMVCAKCHGPRADGDTDKSGEMMPPPANLTLVNNSFSMMLSIARNGVPGTKMPGVPGVSHEFEESMFEYIKSLPKSHATQWDEPRFLDKNKVDLEFGKKIYTTSCIGCHGPDGKGQSEFGNNPYVWPKPANFQARNSDVHRLYYTISHGRSGTMMAPQSGRLSEEARWAAALYVSGLFNPNSKDEIRTPDGGVPDLKNKYRTLSKAHRTAAENNFELYCVACHGEQGKGTFIAPQLTDRQWLYDGGTDTALFVILEEGIPGKQMPSWKQLSEDERWQLIALLRQWGGEPDPRTE